MPRASSEIVPDTSRSGWDVLPPEIWYMILDSLEWPTHSACKQVCQAWKVYLDQPKLVSKRYHAPHVPNRVFYRVRDAITGELESQVVEKPGARLRNPMEIHRILGEPGLGFFLEVQEGISQLKFGKHCYFSNGDGQYPLQIVENETDLREQMPGSTVGKMIRRAYNPKCNSEEDPKLNEFILQESRKWCLRMKCIPFMNELAFLGLPESIDVRLVPPFAKFEGTVLYYALTESLKYLLKKSKNGVTVRELVYVVSMNLMEMVRCGVITKPVGKSYFLRFCGLRNERDTYSSAQLLLEISLRGHCEWVKEDLGNESDVNLGQLGA
ncbi:hypothetical protein H072_1835 [Dactylellina haptotyla CBS 200.50]|uniref:Uncharacterized protein n=2 Tax=Dactylellina haptotyla TaxID=430498 RepID=S8BXF9_DACHA|nr:hypothetical protein [Dactylellina haptotyla]EPS44198.1 hypothetical protein H072_1835 [Dactylellina haptotyla CBS 200.50]